MLWFADLNRIEFNLHWQLVFRCHTNRDFATPEDILVVGVSACLGAVNVEGQIAIFADPALVIEFYS